MKNPCQPDCPQRSGTCRLTCDTVKAFYESRREGNEQRAKERNNKRMLDDYVSDAIRRAKR